MFPFLLPLLGLLGAAGGAAAGIGGAVKAGNEANKAQEEAYAARLNRQRLEGQMRGGMMPMPNRM